MKEFKPDFSRLRKVLLRDGEPDIVPFWELFADTEIIEAVIGKPVTIESAIEYQLKLGFDYAGAGVFLIYDKKLKSTEDTAELSRGQRTFVDDNHGVIETRKDFDAYKWPEVTEAVAINVDKTAKLIPDGMKVIVGLPGGVLENVMWLMGYVPFSYAIHDDEQLISDLFEKIGSDFCKALKLTLENCDISKIGAVSIGDDMGFKHSTMISPELLRKYVFPWHKKLVDIAHSYDLPMILHSCGYLDEVMDDIIDYCGFDAKQSFEDNITPITVAKKKWGDRIALIGGIDMHFLCTANEEQIRAYVDNVIEVCAPGGGYALGTGNTVANYIPLENYLVMLDQGRKKGVYPIR